MAEFNIEKMTQNVAEKVIAIVREDYIHKANYENRLKADMVAMLTELQLEIEETDHLVTSYSSDTYVSYNEIWKLIQQKIDKLSEVSK